jgi:diguanylate cyclase (GGDEF)-like protein
MDIKHVDKLLNFFDRLPGPVLTSLSALSVLLIGLLDYITGSEISVALLYLLPIMLIAWLKGRGSAALLSIFSALVWLFADILDRQAYAHLAISLWNAAMGLGVFLIVGYSVAAIKKLLLLEHGHAHTDYVTGVANARSFYEQMNRELERSARYGRPVAIAYIDVDNFKQVNDTLGHATGDKVLHSVAQAIKSSLRSVDFVSRLGGDEFAVFMPETDAAQADIAVRKVRARLQKTVKDFGWPVTFSIGIATCDDSACTADKLIKAADELMYAAKKEGKNRVRFKKLDV